MSGLIQQLIADGELVLFHDYRSGSFRDWSENGNDGVPSGVHWAGKHIEFPEGSIITVADSAELRITSGTLVVYSNTGFMSQTNYQTLISSRSVAGINYAWSVNAGPRWYLSSDSTTVNVLTDFRGTRCAAISFASGQIPVGYAEGIVVVNAFSAAFVPATAALPLQIGNRYTLAPTYNLESLLSAAMIINRELTATEHAQLYSELAENGGPS